MTADWNNLPIELRVKVINKLDFISRARLGACAKLEHNLIRSTEYKIDRINISSTDIWLEQDMHRIRISSPRFSFETHLLMTQYPRNNFMANKTIRKSWETALMNIFNTIGSKCVVGSLLLKIEKGFENKIDWFRNNINFEPMTVHVTTTACVVDADRFLEWPKNVKITCVYDLYNGEFLEKLNSYDNIVTFKYFSMFPFGRMTDEKLMKLPNATNVFVDGSDLTNIGVARWVKQWLLRSDFEKMMISVKLHYLNGSEIQMELDGFITGFQNIDYCILIRIKNQLNGKVGELELSDRCISFRALDE